MKKFNKIIIFGLFFLVIGIVAYAQSFEEACSQLALNPVTKGDFTQIKTVNSAKGKRELKSYGDFILCQEGIVWNTKKPFPSKMVVSKTRIVQISSDGKQSVIEGKDNQTFASIAATVTAVFSNNVEEINKAFNTDFKALSDGKWELLLDSKDSTIAAAIGTIKLTGTSSGKSTSLDSMVIQESANSEITYIFSNQSYFKELSNDEKALFAF